MLDPASHVGAIKGIGPKAEERLGRLGIETAWDLLLHLPMRYEDRSKSVPFKSLEAGQEALVTGQVVAVDMPRGRRQSLLVHLTDETGYFNLRWFHFSRGQREGLRVGCWVRAYGAIRYGSDGIEMVHPDYRVFGDEPGPSTEGLAPVYPSSAGLTSKRMRQWTSEALVVLDDGATSTLESDFASFADALRYLHRPDAAENATERLEAARKRVVLDEFLSHYLVLRRRRERHKTLETTPLPSVAGLGRRLLSSLGFHLTAAQARTTTEILNDLSGSTPMMRLLQGDVGAGKTIVAAFAAIRAVENEGQVAIMAPTEVLAEQHFETFSRWLEPLDIRVGLITGRLRAAARRERQAEVATGDLDIVVGTHALFQDEVTFHRLVLAIVDEQHRFGVHQRMQLRDKGHLPHQLIMTATPIPRTLTMALYADMDVSVIDELPPGRQTIQTRVIGPSQRERVISYVEANSARGQQTYWVCTLIEDDDEIDAHAAEAVFAEFEARLTSKCGLVHGRMNGDQKSAVMAAFKAGEIDVLVATTVIEVGVDVANATLMVIDNAERLGLAQLHQLRGRVGRGSEASACMLLWEHPVSEVARQRLETLRSSNDGFKIAERDLELRGPGDILGTRQTGEQAFRVADLGRDAHLISEVASLGDRLLTEDPDNVAKIIATWVERPGRYADV